MQLKMKNYKKLTADSALKRKNLAPQLVVVAPSGSGKSTLVYSLFNPHFIPIMKIGIGEKSQTTIIPCEFYFDERIIYDDSFAISIIKKEYSSKDIHSLVLTKLIDLLVKNDFEVEETLEAFDEDVLYQIIEPEEAHYHLKQIQEEISLKELLCALEPILNYIVKDFDAKVRIRKEELKGKKVKLSEIREAIFEEMFEEMPNNGKTAYIEWLQDIGNKIEDKLINKIGFSINTGDIIRDRICNLTNGDNIIDTLLDPSAPFSFVIDYITIACKPRQELIKIAQKEFKDIPFRVCIRDTMGLTQRGIDATSTKEALESALNCKADAILFLLSLDERNDTLYECCNALNEKKEEIKKKTALDIPIYLLFTKADRKVENLINKSNLGDLIIDENTYKENIDSVINELEKTVSTYEKMFSKDNISWISMRYLRDSYILKALDGNEYKKNFEPEGLFEKIAGYSFKALKHTLPNGLEKPLFITVNNPEKPAIMVSVLQTSLQNQINIIQDKLCKETNIVHGYIISNNTPRLHGRSVCSYWKQLSKGLGHSTRSYIYGNFSINMKGLLKRILLTEFPMFEVFNTTRAIELNVENLNDDMLKKIIETISHSESDFEINSIIGERNIVLKRLYNFYTTYLAEESRFASLIDRVAYNLSYGNPTWKQEITKVYNRYNGYDQAMRKVQERFKEFFGSENFQKILVDELSQGMTEMINKTLVII